MTNSPFDRLRELAAPASLPSAGVAQGLPKWRRRHLLATRPEAEKNL